LPVLYLRGVSTGDFQEALGALLGKDAPNLSATVITRLTAEWRAKYDARQKRDLSARRYTYVWADGVYLQARMEDRAECMLVLIGATPEGKKELIGFQTGVRESARSWRELLIDIKRRRLEIAPDLAVGDGALGFWKAIEEVFPGRKGFRFRRSSASHSPFAQRTRASSGSNRWSCVSASMMPQLVQIMRGPTVGTATSSGHWSALNSA
jgi:putative transposase